jgi:hypothetical protein
VQPERKSILPLIALLLLVPAPSVGVALAMLYEPTAGTTLGKAAYGFAKVWIAVLPVLWLLAVERQRISLSPPRHGGFAIGIALGAAVGLLVVALFFLFGDRLIDPATVRAKAAENGLDTFSRFILLALYLTFINALLEEYVWRWFVFRQCEKLLPAKLNWLAVVLSAILFTLHHVLALAAQFDWIVVVLGSLGVFLGGAIWSWCYLKYRSIWIGYVSHLIVDAAIFYVAWRMIFAT